MWTVIWRVFLKILELRFTTVSIRYLLVLSSNIISQSSMNVELGFPKHFSKYFANFLSVRFGQFVAVVENQKKGGRKKGLFQLPILAVITQTAMCSSNIQHLLTFLAAANVSSAINSCIASFWKYQHRVAHHKSEHQHHSKTLAQLKYLPFRGSSSSCSYSSGVLTTSFVSPRLVR